MNVGISTAVEFLKKKGFEVEENPNAKITDEQFDLLRQEFSTDKDLKVKSDQFILGRKEKDKDKVKPAVAIQGYEPAPEKPKQKFKPIGKIDLDKLNKPAKQAEVKPAEIKKKFTNQLKSLLLRQSQLSLHQLRRNLSLRSLLLSNRYLHLKRSRLKPLHNQLLWRKQQFQPKKSLLKMTSLKTMVSSD